VKRYAAVFFMVLLAFGVVSCDDSNSKSEFELLGTWIWTKTTEPQYNEKIIILNEGTMLIGRDAGKDGYYEGWANFTIMEYNEDNNYLRARCTYTNPVYDSIWSTDPDMHYFTYGIVSDELYYKKGSGPDYPDAPTTADFGPYAKQPPAK